MLLVLDSEKKEAISAIAITMHREVSDIINEAITAYLEMNQWMISEIEKGIREAEANDFATEAEVQDIFTKLTNED